jgi:DNA replication protein DnaC
LILDDLGTEMVNQFSTSCLYSVLNNRINLARPTIINTNLTAKEIKEKYAERITSRIFGEFQILRFIGTDVRRQKLSKK